MIDQVEVIGPGQDAANVPAVISSNQSNGVLSRDTALFDHLSRLSEIMASQAFIPKHLVASDPQRTRATCFRIAAQAARWGMDPFVVADSTYSIGGKLGYEGKLIIALLNSRAGLVGRLAFSFVGSGDQLTVNVSGRFKDEAESRSIHLSVAQAKTANEMWSKDPEQKLCYCGALRWARRHCPELVSGVLTPEDLEAMAAQEPAPQADPEEAARKRREAAAAQLAAASKASAQAPTATATATQPNPAVDPVSEKTLARIAALQKTTTLSRDQLKDVLTTKFKVDSSRKLTELQGLDFAGCLLQAQPNAGSDGDARKEAPVAMDSATPSPAPQPVAERDPGDDSAEISPAPQALATAAPQGELSDKPGSVTQEQLAEMRGLSESKAWPRTGPNSQREYLDKVKAANFRGLSQQQAAKLIVGLKNRPDVAVDSDTPF